jgi:internalin A
MIKPSKIKLYYNGALVEKEIPLEHFPFTYWLDNVQYFCQEVNSDATLLVQSKMDIAGTSKIRISDVDVEKYAINDENMLTVSVEGTSTGQAKFIRSFDDFEEQLLETLEKTKRTYDFSTKWLEIKNELRERGKTQFKFSYKEYIDFCDKIRPDIDKPGEEGTSTMLDLLTDYLHDIGVILYYKEITELKDTVFLNPQKVTDIIYKILDYAVMEEDGKFDIGHVNAVAQGIKKDGIEIEAKDIIALMKQFDLIFPVKNRLGQFVAPQYLPEDIGGGKKAYNRFKEKPNCIHAFTLYYPRFLPRSVISRVICHFGNLSNDDYWKNGILFSKQSTDCLIEAFNDEKIKVELSSESLSLINEIFDKIYQVSGKNAEVQISLDGKSFVAIKKLLTHPFQNPIITATNGEELLYESFIERGILLGNRGKESALFDISKETAIINVQNQSKATKENKTIFFSYAWGVNEASGENREAIVDELYESLEKDGIYELKRDKKDAGYRASIKKFMKDIGKGKLVVVVISDKYLKSPNCMFELLAIFRSAGSDTEEFRERIFPIVLGDANKIYDEIDRLDYVEFWQSKCKKFEEKINKIGLEDARSALPAFDSWIEIKNNVGKIAGILGDLNTLNPKALSVDNFAEIKKSITE